MSLVPSWSKTHKQAHRRRAPRMSKKIFPVFFFCSLLFGWNLVLFVCVCATYILWMIWKYHHSCVYVCALYCLQGIFEKWHNSQRIPWVHFFFIILVWLGAADIPNLNFLYSSITIDCVCVSLENKRKWQSLRFWV